MTGVKVAPMYIGHLHRLQFMAEKSFQPNLNSPSSTMTTAEIKIEASDIPTKMHFESYAPREIAEDDRSARNEHSDTSQKMGTQGSQQRSDIESMNSQSEDVVTTTQLA